MAQLCSPGLRYLLSWLNRREKGGRSLLSFTLFWWRCSEVVSVWITGI